MVLPQGLAAADAHLRHCLVLHCALKSPRTAAAGGDGVASSAPTDPSTAGTAPLPLHCDAPASPRPAVMMDAGSLSPFESGASVEPSAICSPFQLSPAPSRENSPWMFEGPSCGCCCVEMSDCTVGVPAPHCDGGPQQGSTLQQTGPHLVAGSAADPVAHSSSTLIRVNTAASSCGGQQQQLQGSGRQVDVAPCCYDPLRAKERHEVCKGNWPLTTRAGIS